VLRHARVDAGLSQRAVARAVGRTPSAVWQWEEGRGAPNAATVARLEELLRLEPDSLARLLGYAPPTRQATSSVVDALQADPRLDDSGRELLTTVYRWLVRRGSVGEGTS
jgi:transcriptional regulator with XRE-family HTH domain